MGPLMSEVKDVHNSGRQQGDGGSQSNELSIEADNNRGHLMTMTGCRDVYYVDHNTSDGGSPVVSLPARPQATRVQPSSDNAIVKIVANNNLGLLHSYQQCDNLVLTNTPNGMMPFVDSA